MWLIQKVFILLTARHQPERILPPPLVTTSTITCQIVQLNRRGSAFIIGILVLDVEKQELLKSHIVGKWHIITFQEAIEYLEHDFLTNRFHVTHNGGCAVLFNKDTLFSDNKVSSFYLHDTRTCEKYSITEGESGWVMQGVVSKAAFRRQPRNG